MWQGMYSAIVPNIFTLAHGVRQAAPFTVLEHLEHYAVAGHIFQAYPVWIYTQSNITNIIWNTVLEQYEMECTQCSGTEQCLLYYYYLLFFVYLSMLL
jgi:hypothetical protein